jgi:hypothetical protein
MRLAPMHVNGWQHVTAPPQSADPSVHYRLSHLPGGAQSAELAPAGTAAQPEHGDLNVHLLSVADAPGAAVKVVHRPVPRTAKQAKVFGTPACRLNPAACRADTHTSACSTAH